MRRVSDIQMAAQEILDQRGDQIRLFDVQHVSRTWDVDDLETGDDRAKRLLGAIGAEPRSGIRTRSPSSISIGALIARQHASASSRLYSTGLTQRWRASPSRCTRPSASRLRPDFGDEIRLRFGEARIAGADDGRKLLEGVVILEGRHGLHLIQPFAQRCRAPDPAEVRGSPNPSKIDEASHALAAAAPHTDSQRCLPCCVRRCAPAPPALSCSSSASRSAR